MAFRELVFVQLGRPAALLYTSTSPFFPACLVVLPALAGTPPRILSLRVGGDPCRSLPPRRPPVAGLELCHLLCLLAPFRRAPNLPICLPPLISRPQHQCGSDRLAVYSPLVQRRLALLVRHIARQGHGLRGVIGAARCCGLQVTKGLKGFGLGHLVGEHAEFPTAHGVRRLGEGLVLLEYNADVFALGMAGWIAVVGHIAWDLGVDGVITALQ